uniref:Short neurotoxin n=1 Tax=Micropechis ikaheca TaxID=66188 RepID=A0A024AXD4_MICIK|nr:short neurotoxin [Micropechis ikaheca]
MKTLLLTLVVVTIVCLDLGYTMICCNQQSTQPKTTKSCSGGETSCYKMSWNGIHGSITERGCGCPTVKRGISLMCCHADECNN